MKIGEEVEILEEVVFGKRFIKVKIIKIYKKKLYNMYLCENLKNKQRTTFTDMDESLGHVRCCYGRRFKESKSRL